MADWRRVLKSLFFMQAKMASEQLNAENIYRKTKGGKLATSRNETGRRGPNFLRQLISPTVLITIPKFVPTTHNVWRKRTFVMKSETGPLDAPFTSAELDSDGPHCHWPWIMWTNWELTTILLRISGLRFGSSQYRGRLCLRLVCGCPSTKQTLLRSWF